MSWTQRPATVLAEGAIGHNVARQGASALPVGWATNAAAGAAARWPARSTPSLRWRGPGSKASTRISCAAHGGRTLAVGHTGGRVNVHVVVLLGRNLALQVGLVGGEALQGVVRAEVSRTEVAQLALAILPETMAPKRDALPRR
eukprot:4357661-Alexandrium_andersonii.AAC.1